MALTNLELAVILFLWVLGWMIAWSMGQFITGIWQFMVRNGRAIRAGLSTVRLGRH
jgi:hypothetical protein